MSKLIIPEPFSIWTYEHSMTALGCPPQGKVVVLGIAKQDPIEKSVVVVAVISCDAVTMDLQIS